jgi:hypothetical protein
MHRTDLATNLGSGISYVKFTLGIEDFTAAALTQAIQLRSNPGGNAIPTPGTTTATLNEQNFWIPQGGVILWVRIKHTVQFAAPAANSLILELAKTVVGTVIGDTATLAPAPTSGNLFAAVADTTLAQTTGFVFPAALGHAPYALEVLATSIGGFLNTFTQGSVNIYVCFLNPTSATSPSVSGV